MRRVSLTNPRKRSIYFPARTRLCLDIAVIASPAWLISIMKRFSREHLWHTVDLKHGDIPLLVMCYTTGLLDASSYNEWGVFVGMQTGTLISYL
jgi:thiamine transporter ThiT